jgi:hypothetical protein
MYSKIMHYEDSDMAFDQTHCRPVTADAPTELQGYYLSAKPHNCRPLVGKPVRQNLQRLFVTGALFLIITVGAGCSPTDSETGGSPTKIVKSSDPNVVEMDHPEQFPLVAVALFNKYILWPIVQIKIHRSPKIATVFATVLCTF